MKMRSKNQPNPSFLTPYIQLTLLIWITYILLTGNLEISNLVVGLIIGWSISILVRPQRMAIHWQKFPRALLASIQYLVILIWDLLKSGIQVSRIIINPKLPIDPGIVMIDAGCQGETGTALSAHALTLTPGEIVLEMDDEGHLYTHCLDVKETAKVAGEAQALRKELLSRIFE